MSDRDAVELAKDHLGWHVSHVETCCVLARALLKERERAERLIRYGNALRGTHGETCRYDDVTTCPAVTDWDAALAEEEKG